MLDFVAGLIVNGSVGGQCSAVWAGIGVGFLVVLEIGHGIQAVVLGGMFLWGGVGRDPAVGAYLQMLGGGIPLVGKGVHFFDAQKLFGIPGHG